MKRGRGRKKWRTRKGRELKEDKENRKRSERESKGTKGMVESKKHTSLIFVGCGHRGSKALGELFFDEFPVSLLSQPRKESKTHQRKEEKQQKTRIRKTRKNKRRAPLNETHRVVLNWSFPMKVL